MTGTGDTSSNSKSDRWPPDVLLDRFLAGELSEADARTFAAEVGRSPQAAARLEARKAERAAFYEADPPEAFAHRVAVRLAQEPERQRAYPRTPWWVWWAAPSLAAAATLVLVVKFTHLGENQNVELVWHPATDAAESNPAADATEAAPNVVTAPPVRPAPDRSEPAKPVAAQTPPRDRDKHAFAEPPKARAARASEGRTSTKDGKRVAALSEPPESPVSGGEARREARGIVAELQAAAGADAEATSELQPAPRQGDEGVAPLGRANANASATDDAALPRRYAAPPPAVGPAANKSAPAPEAVPATAAQPQPAAAPPAGAEAREKSASSQAMSQAPVAVVQRLVNGEWQPTTTARVGDRLRVRIKANGTGQVLVLSQDDAGKREVWLGSATGQSLAANPAKALLGSPFTVRQSGALRLYVLWTTESFSLADLAPGRPGAQARLPFRGGQQRLDLAISP